MITKQDKLILAGHRLREARCKLFAISFDDIPIDDYILEEEALSELETRLDEAYYADEEWKAIQAE